MKPFYEKRADTLKFCKINDIINKEKPCLSRRQVNMLQPTLFLRELNFFPAAARKMRRPQCMRKGLIAAACDGLQAGCLFFNRRLRILQPQTCRPKLEERRRVTQIKKNAG